MSGYGPIAAELSRYNQWQNEKLFGVLAALPPEELTRDRGMFFGDMLATLDHIPMAVPYTHPTLPTIYSVEIPAVRGTINNKRNYTYETIAPHDTT